MSPQSPEDSAGVVNVALTTLKGAVGSGDRMAKKPGKPGTAWREAAGYALAAAGCRRKH